MGTQTPGKNSSGEWRAIGPPILSIVLKNRFAVLTAKYMLDKEAPKNLSST
jgi:hypothetical protein